MSDTQTDDRDGQQDGDDEELVARARRAGWKGPEAYKGDPARFVTAKQFLDRMESPAILAERYKTLEERYGRLEGQNRQISSKLDEAVQTVAQITEMHRNADKRAYDRALRDLKAERDKAVEVGDTATYKAKDAEIEELAKTAPAPVVARPQVAPAPQTQTAPVPAEVLAFYGRNPWYMTSAELRSAADLAFARVGGPEKRGADLDAALRDVEAQMRRVFPQEVGGGDDGRPQRQRNRREEDVGDVDPSTPSDGPRREPRNRFTFDAIPKESKDAYAKYSRMLDGKGKPLTKEEWAADYWSQFQDDGRG